MSNRPTPMTDANVASLTKTPDCFCEADFARDLERKLAVAREVMHAAAVFKSRAPWHSIELKELTKGLSHKQDIACCKAFINAYDDAKLAVPFDF